MKQEEKDLALKLYDRMMVGIFNLAESDIIAKDCVKAARSIYQAIEAVEQQEIEDEKAIKEKEIEDLKARKEQLKQELEANKKDARWFIVYRKCQYKNERIEYRCTVNHTTQYICNYLNNAFFLPDSSLKQIGIYEISKDEAEIIILQYKKKNRYYSEIKCNSFEDFSKYIGMCPLAKPIDMTNIKTGGAEIVYTSLLDAMKK